VNRGKKLSTPAAVSVSSLLGPLGTVPRGRCSAPSAAMRSSLTAKPLVRDGQHAGVTQIGVEARASSSSAGRKPSVANDLLSIRYEPLGRGADFPATRGKRASRQRVLFVIRSTTERTIPTATRHSRRLGPRSVAITPREALGSEPWARWAWLWCGTWSIRADELHLGVTTGIVRAWHDDTVGRPMTSR
jgi:hypothetical protein